MPVTAIDPPVGGLNAFDSVSAMPPTDAVALTNWIPRSGFLESRPGSILYADLTSFGGGPVETLVPWKGAEAAIPTGQARANRYNTVFGTFNAAADDFQLLAAANGELYNVTTGTGVVLGSGFTNNRWQSAMINDRLVLVNGADGPYEFDGTNLNLLSTWQLWDSIAEVWIPFPNPEQFIGCVSFKGRMYYCCLLYTSDAADEMSVVLL